MQARSTFQLFGKALGKGKIKGLADFGCTGHGEGSWIKELVGTWSLRIIWNLKFEFWDLFKI